MISIPNRGDYFFLFKIIIYFYFFSDIFYILWGWFGGNFNDSSLKSLNTFNMIVLDTVSYIFLGVAMMRLEPAMKIEIIISFPAV